ncbi:MAG: phytanoyl-CoA dioxygenase family protein, partial [Magnetovibrio sp.]|nr:phytanoyl-CoA dioxygenase family protein [Magnetovibrio sp.]
MDSSNPLNAVTPAQKAFFEDQGYLSLPGFVGADWLERLGRATARTVEESRGVTASDEKFDVEDDHTADNPRLRRLMRPQDHDDAYHAFATSGPIVDLAADLLGPDVKFHHGKLNFKWSGGGTEVKWHQDIPFWPHTAYNVLTIGLALADITDEMGPMGVLPASHKGPVFDHYSAAGDWQGFIGADDLQTLDLSAADYLKGPAGTLTVHHCRTVHGSKPNTHVAY